MSAGRQRVWFKQATGWQGEEPKNAARDTLEAYPRGITWRDTLEAYQATQLNHPPPKMLARVRV